MPLQRQEPVSESVTLVEFAVSDPRYPFVAASTHGGQVTLEEIIPRGNSKYGEFYSIEDTDPNEVLALADEHGSVDAELLARHEDGGLFEFVVSDNCPAVFLGEEGALPRRIKSSAGKGSIAAEIPANKDPSAIINRFLNAHPETELTRKCQQSYTTPLFSHRELQQAIEEALTDRQQEALAAAHEAGYYEWPRDITGEELADDMGISPATFHQHLRAAEQTLIATLFDGRQA